MLVVVPVAKRNDGDCFHLDQEIGVCQTRDVYDGHERWVDGLAPCLLEDGVGRTAVLPGDHVDSPLDHVFLASAGRLKHEFLLDENETLPGVTGKPVLIQHGRSDEALKVEAAERSAELLAGSGADVTLKLYDAGHRITPEMVGDMRAWLEERSPASA